MIWTESVVHLESLALCCQMLIKPIGELDFARVLEEATGLIELFKFFMGSHQRLHFL